MNRNLLRLWVVVGLLVSMLLTAGTCYILFPADAGKINYEGVARVIEILVLVWILGVGLPIYFILKTNDENKDEKK